MSPRPIRDLSRRQRLVRYRQLAARALRAYGLADAHLTFVQYLANVIYRVDLPGDHRPVGGGGPFIPNRYLLRLHAWDNIPYINGEMLWLEALASEGGLAVQKPMRALDGEFCVQVRSEAVPEGRCATLLRWLDGRKLEKGLRPKHLAALGRTVARLHEFSAHWEPPEGFSRPTWDWAAQLGGSHFEMSIEELVGSMPQQFRAPFWTVSEEAKAAMASLGQGPDAFGLIHADLYPENILYKAGQAYPIDFEDCGYGWWLWDIAVALCTWAWGPDWERMRDAFYEGYTSLRGLPAAQWDLLDLFIATQYATMLIWASAFLWNDPMRAADHTPWRDESGTALLTYFDR
jgi:Ser/Thr protein kinase RdoA (MazF antagonist)